MLNRLQTRLMVSYVLILGITLVLIGVVLIVFLRSRPVPADELLSELAAVSVQTEFIGVDPVGGGENAPGPLRQRLLTELDEVQSILDETAAETGYRTLLATDDGRVLYDSAGIYLQGERLRGIQRRPARSTLIGNRQSVLGYGEYREDEQTWIFVSRRVYNGGPNNRDRPVPPIEYLVATPQPKPTLRLVLSSFGDTFFVPLLRSGGIALVVALGLSFWISRSVAKPLRAVAAAAGKVAAGDYDQRISVQGPSEARVVARAFNNMTEQVKLNQQAQQDFIANVTHDLRTPLTSIQGFSQAIIDGVAADPESAEHAAQVINDEATRLTRLVNDLLDIAKIQAGRLQMMRHTVQLDAVLKTVGKSLSIEAEQRKVSLHQDIPPLPHIAGDGDRLAQVFTNLVDNAIKHTGSDGQVWFHAKPEGGGILVQVQDTGEGIPPEDLSRIFERFYQVDKSRHRTSQWNSAGLGLAITYEIVRAHGGRIWVESEVGVGSRFNVWLPVISREMSTIIARKA